MRISLTILCSAVLGLAASCAQAISGGVGIAPNDTRFDSVAGVTLTEWVGINNVFGNATLVAANRVVLPRHLINRNFPNRRSVDGTAGAFTIRFRRTPDGLVGTADNPASFHHVRVKEWIFPTGRKDTDDVVIGILETPVTHIAPAVVDMKAKVNKRSVLSVVSWGPVAVQLSTPVSKGTPLAGSVAVTSFDKNKFRIGPPSPAAPAGVVPNDSGTPILQVNGGVVKIVGFVTTTTGGVSLQQLEGTRLFPRVPRARR